MMRLLSILAALLCLAALTLPTLAQQSPSLLPRETEIETRTAEPSAAPVAPTGVAPLTREDLEAWLDGFLPYALTRGDVAGAVVAIVDDGEVLLQKGYGYADVAERTPVDPARTLFRPGSVSKLFTWTAVMQLVERGELDLDTDINTYLDFEISPHDGPPITLRNIMTHTAGFEERIKELFVEDVEGVEPLGDYLERWVPERIFASGTTPAYSNYATALAGYIVERVSDQPFNVYVERNIFEPLGMRRSTFRQPLPPRLRPLMSKGYVLGSGEPEPYEMIPAAPAGSLASTGADMARFMIAHLQDGRLGSARILEPQTARMMHSSALTTLAPLNRMVLGFYETNINGHRVIAHAGDTVAFHTALHLFLDDGVGLYISMNSAGREGAAGDIRSHLFEEFSDRYFPGDPRDGAVDAETAAEHARMIAGLYDNSRRSESSFIAIANLLGQFRVAANDDGTISVAQLTGLNGQPVRWREISPFVWREVGGPNRLAAKIVDGEVVRFSIDQISPFMVFEPVSGWKSSAWLIPALVASLIALALTAVFWPVGAIVRRRYGAAFTLVGRDARAYRWVRISAAAAVLTMVAWVVTFLMMSSDIGLLSRKIDPWLWILQILSLVVFFGAFGLALWNAWQVWTGKRGWFGKLWSIVLVLASLVLLWVALAFNLIGFTVNY